MESPELLAGVGQQLLGAVDDSVVPWTDHVLPVLAGMERGQQAKPQLLKNCEFTEILPARCH